MNLRPKTFVIRKEARALRCEICHLSDCFDREKGTCTRCAGIELPEPASLRHPFPLETHPPVMMRVIRKLSGMMGHCLYGLGASLFIFLAAALLGHFSFSQGARVIFTIGITLLTLVVCALVPLIVLYFTCMIGYVTFDMGREMYGWIRSLLQPNPPR